ncbi:Abi family protein [Enterococcus villorum]|uniref:Abi family protein n=1 Tax=Enterococcus villorum TaxID=112904 RepID=UPI001F4D55EB|nr:Abi family protein [Enterococcus villorum]
MSHFSGILEEWIKATFANIISNHYISNEYRQAEFYLDLDIYVNEKQGREILTNFSEMVTRSKETYIKYHHKEKNGCIPVWVLIEELTFGQIDTFISQLKPDYKNMWIDKVFGKRYRKFVISRIGVARYRG